VGASTGMPCQTVLDADPLRGVDVELIEVVD
jgi:hypothetical protein